MEEINSKIDIASNKKFISLESYYEESLNNYINSEYSAGNLFYNKQAEKFIANYFREERKNKKISSCLNRITPFRAIHTVSSFLLGLTIRDKLQFDTRSWRRLPGEKSPKGSFELFWSWICLFHDIGYFYEENPDKYAGNKTISELINALKIKNNLLDESSHRELIENYYKMRIDTACKTDHGIVGAILLYDALIDLAKSNNIYSKIKKHREFFAKICDTIALHNMWRATNSSVKEYNKYGLNELIPDESFNHMIYYNENPILFLLALVDTIDPIKNFCRDGRHRIPVTAVDVLENVYLRFIGYSGLKRVDIRYNNSLFNEYSNNIKDENMGLMSWLGTYVQYNTEKGLEKILSITVDLNDKLAVKDKGA